MSPVRMPSALVPLLAVAAALVVALHAASHHIPAATLAWRTGFTLLSVWLTQWNLVSTWKALSRQPDAGHTVPSPARAR